MKHVFYQSLTKIQIKIASAGGANEFSLAQNLSWCLKISPSGIKFYTEHFVWQKGKINAS